MHNPQIAIAIILCFLVSLPTLLFVMLMLWRNSRILRIRTNILHRDAQDTQRKVQTGLWPPDDHNFYPTFNRLPSYTRMLWGMLGCWTEQDFLKQLKP